MRGAIVCVLSLFLFIPVPSLAHDPDAPETFLPRALGLGTKGHFDRASEALEKTPGQRTETVVLLKRVLRAVNAGKMEPQAAMLFFKAELCLRDGNESEAVKYFELSSAVSPDYSDTWMMLGKLHSAGDAKRAIGDLQKAVSIDPRNAQAQEELAFLYVRRGNNERASLHFLKAIAAGYDDAWTYTALGNAYSALDRKGEALKAYAEALRRDDGSGEAYLGIGSTYLKAGDFALARDNLAAAKRLFQARGQWGEADSVQSLLDSVK